MILNDALTIDGMRRTQDGYLAVSAKVARAGNVQLYAGAEVGRPDLTTVRVYRPAEEVFAADTMRSFAHRPMTLGHPAAPVTADSWKSAARGWTGEEVVRDGDAIRVSMLLADTDAIAAVQAGTKELSAGYNCELIWGEGRTPDGHAYDAKQTRIRANHIAVVPQARGGSTLRIGDAAMQTQDASKMTLDQVAALPQYEAFRGKLWRDGTPLDRHYASLDMARAAAGDPRVASTYDHMAQRMGEAWRKPHQEAPPAPAFAKDGQRFADLDAREQAHERMALGLQDAWKAA